MRRLRLISTVMLGGVGAALVTLCSGCKSDDSDKYSEGLIPPVGAPAMGNRGDNVPGSPSSEAPLGEMATDEPLDLASLATIPYEIQKGDTLSGIASAHGTTISVLQQLNGIEGSRIFYGKLIKVPAPAGAAPAGGAAPESSPSVPSPETVASPPATTTPEVPVNPTPPPTPSTPETGGAETGFGFGGDSAPRIPPQPRAADDESFLKLPPN